MPRVLLTQGIENRPLLGALLQERGWELRCQSFIATETINFEREVERFTWVFFSSRNGVRHFFSQSPLLSERVKFAAIGQSTAAELSQFGTVAFAGNDTNTSDVGRAFAELLSPIDEVLFPIGMDSLRTVQRQLPPSQVNDLICYETRLLPAALPVFDTYVFSSPSNVKSFLSKNSIPQGAKVISFGASTTKALQHLELEKVVDLKDYSDESIAMAIISA
jgi:uroporphyrinogen-III synthase